MAWQTQARKQNAPKKKDSHPVALQLRPGHVVQTWPCTKCNKGCRRTTQASTAHGHSQGMRPANACNEWEIPNPQCTCQRQTCSSIVESLTSSNIKQHGVVQTTSTTTGEHSSSNKCSNVRTPQVGILFVSQYDRSLVILSWLQVRASNISRLHHGWNRTVLNRTLPTGRALCKGTLKHAYKQAA